jgi:hypothetical protein
MVRGRRGGRRQGARGGGVTPPVASMPEGSNPQGGEQGSRTGADNSWRCRGDDEIFLVHVRGIDQPIGQR